MKTILLLIVFGAGGYYILTHHSPFQLIETDPHYFEARVNIPGTSAQLAGFGRMFSREDCLARSALVWSKVFRSAGEFKLAKNSCTKTLASRYNVLFENKPFHATYIVFEKGNSAERDARFVIFGVPSSIVANECDKIIGNVRKNYSGKIYCVQGTVG